MALADIQSVEELAERIGQPRLGARTLRKITDPNDSRPTGLHEYEAIARVTGVPIEFLTEEELLPTSSESAVTAIRGLLEGHDHHMTALYADLVRRLEQIEATVNGRPAAASLPAPGGELGHRIEEPRTTTGSRGVPGSRSDSDARRGSGR